MVIEAVVLCSPANTCGFIIAGRRYVGGDQNRLKTRIWKSDKATNSKERIYMSNQQIRKSILTRSVQVGAEPAGSQKLTGSEQDNLFEAPLDLPPEYNDSILDLAFIHVCRISFGNVAKWQSPRTWREGYLGMVEVSHALMKGRSAKQQQAAVLQGFPAVPPWFRRLFPYSDWGAQVNASITPRFFRWLVGPCTVEEGEISEGKLLRSTVVIDRCRYLETSGCTAMCVNLCKVPTQHFFNVELGMPLYMEPNFETLGCRMVFGQAPPPIEDDVVMRQSCFSTCPAANIERPSCPKLL